MRIDIAAQTDVGRHKRNNEDYYGVFREDTPGLALFDEGCLLIVADGLGGHMGGEIASKLAVAIVKDVLKQSPPDIPEEDDDPKNSPILVALRESVLRANAEIHRTNTELVTDQRPMGTTLVCAVVEKKKAHIATVGDSRCYHIRDGEIIARTEDHSWVDEQVRLGLMSRAEAESDYRRNIVTRCIGTQPEVAVDTYKWHLVSGDMLLMCTDGLINMVKDADIQQVFRKRATSGAIAHKLVTMANEAGGKDNITVIVAHVNPTMAHFISAFLRKHGKTLLWSLLVLLVGVLGFFIGRLY